jgi:hypothetical protein
MPNGFFALRRVTTAAAYANASGDVGTGGVISTDVPHTLILHNESTVDAEIIALSTSTNDADIFARLIPNTVLRTRCPRVMIPTIYAKSLSGTPVLMIEAEKTRPS